MFKNADVYAMREWNYTDHDSDKVDAVSSNSKKRKDIPSKRTPENDKGLP